ncbi:S8 family peptidase [Aliiglaciecola litoralis]|uniref:Peptidase S8/S53 domain-containing protein n=1 Tax=Aliiglaciecola litoralis TaxID=582857 RepID=A0ABN1LF45_9ALTE
MLNKIVIVAVSLVCIGGGISALTSSEQSKASFIVQGASQDTMYKQIVAVGGEVTHTFQVIEAVSAQLTENQIDRVKRVNPLLRFFSNADVNISSKNGWKTNKPLKYKINKDKVVWVAKNRSDVDQKIEHILLTWPAANGTLTKLKVAGKKLQPGNRNVDFDLTGDSATITLKGKKKISVNAGKKVRIMMEFDKISSVVDADYQIALMMQDGTLVQLQKDQDVTPSLPIRYSVGKNEISWTTANKSERDQYVSKVTFDWPATNGLVEQLKINGKNVLAKPVSGGTSSVKLSEYIAIEGEKDIVISMAFSELASVDDLEYDVELEFADRTTQQFRTTNATPQQGNDRDTFYPSVVNADQAHERGITGAGVTVAIIDTGFEGYKTLEKTTSSQDRFIHTYNVLDIEESDKVEDGNGHGTHIASVIANSSQTFSLNGQMRHSYNGIAPDSDLVIIKAFDEQGRASYADILKAIEYVIENQSRLNIKVLNLSFSATPSSNYWDDPINQAVMRAWDAGITVLAAAGNQGPEAMTIGVPGNTPYVITVGAMSDAYTPEDPSDDFVTSFSSAGPTFEGFVKPEVIAPGGHIQGLLDDDSYIGENYEIYDDNDNYFILSGSSQSTAITSGIVALMLQADPSLTPDDIKCRLMYTAKIAITEEGDLAYSIFQQGAGLVDAIAAIDESAKGCANEGMSIALDLAGEDHYIGPAMRYENDGDYYVPGTEGMNWNGLYNDSQLWGNRNFVSNSQLWGNRNFNSDSQLWGNRNFSSDSQLWGNRNFNSDSQLWGNRNFSSDSQLWGNRNFSSDSSLTADAVSIKWVEQQ